MNYKEAVNTLKSENNFYIDLKLDRILLVLKKFGNPQDKIKIIHVAGTNGKGSVCAMLASILKESGYKVGLYTSPHIWEYTERIKINGKDIPKNIFAQYIEKICQCGIHLTEFEILTVVMFLYFHEHNVDIAVVETGLGGRLDATNVIKENLCSIITRIDYDHTDRLGNTLEKIAYEKAGIIKPNCPTITSMNFQSIKDKASEANSNIISPDNTEIQKYINALCLKGCHQKENLLLVISAIKLLFRNIKDEAIISGLKKVKHPCRFEYFKEKNLIIDACHNPNGISSLRNNLDTFFPDSERRFVFGCLKTKDAKKMMEILFRNNDEIYLFGFDYPNAYSCEELSNICPYESKKYTADIEFPPDKLNIICGSFYMISQLKMPLRRI